MKINGMYVGRTSVMTIAIALASWSWQSTPAQCQEASAHSSTTGAADSQDAARRKIIESDRWRQAERRLNEWLSVQTIYTPDEVTAMKADLAARVAKMSPRELEDFMKDTEERLVVLTSPEAEDARRWLAQFMAVARNPEEQLGISRPDVMNMTASQIRLEIERLQRVRDSRLQAQAAFDRAREIQTQSTLDTRAAQQATRAPATSRSNWPANSPRQRPTANVPHRDRLPTPFRPPNYTVGPWGTSITWHP